MFGAGIGFSRGRHAQSYHKTPFSRLREKVSRQSRDG